MTSAPVDAPSANCPRCAYDLRGAVELWIDSCPLNGRCTECGLDYAWTELLGPGGRPPRWFVEARRSTWSFPWQVIATTARAWSAPFSFWRRVQMVHPRRWNRVLAYVAALLFMLYASVCASVGVDALARAIESRRWAISAGTVSLRWSTPVRSAAVPWLDLALPMFVTPPAGFAPSRPPTPPIAIDDSGDTSTGIPLVSSPLTFAGWNPLYSGSDHLWSVLSDAATLLAFFLATNLCAAATFYALPITRRRCRVRMEHVWRVALLGMAVAVMAPLVCVLSDALRNLFDAARIAGWSRWMLTPLADVSIFGTVPLLMLWWWAATTRYLRMPHGIAVGFLCVVAGLCAAGLARACYEIAMLPQWAM